MTKAIFAVLSAALFAFLWFGPQQQQKKRPPVSAPLIAAPGQVVMTTTYTNATNALTDTPLSLTVAGNTVYTMACLLLWSGTGQSLNIAITGPASPVVVGYGFEHARLGAQGTINSVASAFGTKLGASSNSGVVPNQRVSATIGMGLKVGTQAGTITVQATSDQGTITIYPGSFCRVQ